MLLLTEGKIKYHPLSKYTRLRHLGFADDSLLFLNGDEHLEVFDRFKILSGSKFSPDKLGCSLLVC